MNAVRSPLPNPRLALGICLTLVACVHAFYVQPLNCNPASHYALVQALGDGTAIIDDYRDTTCDKAWFEGHYYSDRPPGLAWLGFPVYAALDAVDALPRPQYATYLLNLLIGVVGSVLLAYLVFRAAERLIPRSGLLVAGILSFATLVFPFSTLWFSHVLTAVLAFAGFWLLWQTTDSRHPHLLAAGAGAAVGYGVVVEYSVAIVGVVLAVFAVALGGRLRWKRTLVYGAAALALASPLPVWNAFVYGDPTHASYVGHIDVPGESGHDFSSLPDASAMRDLDPRRPPVLLFGERGLFTVTPVLVACLAGFLWFVRTRRLEGLVSLAIVLLVFGANTIVRSHYGGATPGPRYLILMLPFLVLGGAYALARLPGWLMGALTAISALAMFLATATFPLLSTTDPPALGETKPLLWFDLFSEGTLTWTLGDLAGLADPGFSPLFLPLVALGAYWLLALGAWRGAAFRPVAYGLLVAAAALASAAPELLTVDREAGEPWGALALATGAAALAVAASCARGEPRAALALALPILALLPPSPLAERSKIAFVLTLSLLAAAVAYRAWRREPPALSSRR